MTGEGGAIGFMIRLLLGGALISGGLLYAAQALQNPAATREPVAEKIGPALTTRPAPVRAPVEPTVAAVAPPALASEPPAARVGNSYQADPGPAATPLSASPAGAARSPSAQPQADVEATADTFGVLSEDGAPAAESKPARASRAKKGSAGCTQYKSYNPATQTYRAFDGTIKDCKP